MRALLPFGLVVAVALATPAHAQEGLDDVKARIKIATDKLKADVEDGIARADLAAKKSVRQAIDELEGLEIKFQFARLVPEEARNELSQRVKARINFYRQAQSRGDTRYDLEERFRAQQERHRDFEKKQEAQRAYYNQVSELYRQGKFAEAAELARERGKAVGVSPSIAAVTRQAELRNALSDARSIRDERNTRFRTAMSQIIKSSMPVVNESGIEFPSNWRELTKRRQQFKLTTEEEKLLKALATPITMEFKGQPLQGVLDEFARRYGIQINLDKAALDQLMINSDTMVNVRARSTSLRAVLKQMLADVGLTYVIRKGELFVTTPERASSLMVTRAYYVGDLVTTFNQSFDPFGQNQLAAVQSIASLIQMIQGIEPQTWQAGGGAGTITFDPIRLSIIVKQSAEMHYMLQGSFR